MSPLEYQISVMQAALTGRRIERTERGGTDWVPAAVTDWDWAHYDYRIAPSTVMLTEKQAMAVQRTLRAFMESFEQ